MRAWLKSVLSHLGWTVLVAVPPALVYFWDHAVGAREVRFVYPWMLALLALLPVVFVARILEQRRSARILFSESSTLLKTGRGWRTRFAPAATGLRITALGLMILAAARPQDATGRDRAELEGIDIVVTLDMSGSMKAADLDPTRIEAAKAVVTDFIRRRKNDRIGMVIFGKDAYTLCPLTLDYSALATMIANLDLGDINGDATAIGNALGTALARLRKSDALSKVVILLTDGANNAGQVTPEQSAAFAKTLGVQIYTILMGEEANAPVEMGVDLFGRKIFGQSNFPVNPDLLGRISARTGGRFFHATDRQGLEQSFHEILNALERSKISDLGVLYNEAFGRFLAGALWLIFLELLLRIVILRRLP